MGKSRYEVERQVLYNAFYLFTRNKKKQFNEVRYRKVRARYRHFNHYLDDPDEIVFYNELNLKKIVGRSNYRTHCGQTLRRVQVVSQTRLLCTAGKAGDNFYRIKHSAFVAAGSRTSNARLLRMSQRIHQSA